MNRNFSVGASKELSLRVSIATLSRVLFQNPQDGSVMLALERKAVPRETNGRRTFQIKSQPFGGAIRILNLPALQKLIGDFRFDSERSRAEQDFRIFIQPSDWSNIREVCLQRLRRDDDQVLETSPTRELTEEFAESMNVNLTAEQFTFESSGFVIEDEPTQTDNPHAPGQPTVRVYRIFEVRIVDAALCVAAQTISAGCSDHDLELIALKDSQKGGRANSVLTLPLNLVAEAYRAVSAERRYRKIKIQEHDLDESVLAILENVPAPQYQRA